MVEIALSTARHLWFGVRALLFWPIDPTRMRAIGPEPALLTLVFVLVLGLQGLTTADEFVLSAWGVSCTLASLGAIAGLLLSAARRRGIDLASLMATLIGLDIATLLAITAVPLVAKPAVAVLKLSAKYQLWMTYGAGFILVVWVVAALWLLGRRATPVQPRRFGLAVVAASMLPAIFLPLAPLVPGASQSFNGLLQLAFDAIGAPEPAANAPSTPPIDVEAAFNRQPQLIDAALDRMAPSRSGRHELYFVGMAPYASQDVFKREINSVLGIVDERLGTAGRSLVMINHRDTLQSIPLATVSNLERVLWRLAQIMDTNKDILMLFITTHGSELAVALHKAAARHLFENMDPKQSLDQAAEEFKRALEA